MGNIEKFDIIANQYDTIERIQISKIIADNIRKYVINSKNKKAIDYGCGTGLVGMNLVDLFDPILFIDASSNMVEQVGKKIGELHIKNADTLCCDFITSSYPKDLHADYIFISQVLLHIKDIELLMANLYKVLNNNGHLLIVDFDKNQAVASDEVHNGFDQKLLLNTVKKLGFVNAESVTFYHGKKIFMNKDASLFILDAVK